MKKLFLSILTVSSPLLIQSMPLSASVNTLSTNPSMNHTERLNRILVENRVLARINNNPISVFDVMKKMDTDFYSEYPHLMDSVMARFQYYKARWRSQFERMVESELILEEAKERKIELSDGDIRQEIEEKFGPEVISNIDKVGLTYDEAWEMVKKDILVQRMTSGYLYLKGVFNVPPQDLLSAYQNYINKNKKPDHWKYYMISFKGPNALEKALMAKDLLKNMQTKSKDFKSLILHLKDKPEEFPENEVSISDQFDFSSNEIQESHREVLSNLATTTLSEPLKEVSRVSQKPVYRIFYLTDYIPGGKIELAEVEDKLLKQLRQDKFEQEYLSYVAMLKDRFGVTNESVYDAIPSNFEPFTLK